MLRGQRLQQLSGFILILRQEVVPGERDPELGMLFRRLSKTPQNRLQPAVTGMLGCVANLDTREKKAATHLGRVTKETAVVGLQ